MNTRAPLTPPSALSPQPDQMHLRRQEQDVRAPFGHHGVIPQGEFSLAESAEELTFHMAHRIEDKLHSERKIRGENPLIAIEVKAILTYLEQAREDNAQSRLEELASQILSGHTEPRAAVARFSQNPAQQYLAFYYVLRKGQQKHASEELLAELADALAEIEQRNGPAIRAALNTIDAAAAYGKNATDIHSFQRTYEDVVLGETSLSKALSIALSRFGGKRIAEGLKGLITALGLDLAAARPSVSKERIYILRKDMYYLQVAVTALEGCKELSTRLAKAVSASFNAERLMQQVVKLVDDKWISDSTFLGIATEHGVQSVNDRITFMAGIRSVLKNLPVQIFSDGEARTGVLQAAQNALDNAIDEEFQPVTKSYNE